MELIRNEPAWLVKALKEEIKRLEQVYHDKDFETWDKIEKLVHENSMRYFPYEDGKEFIDVANKLLGKA
ncbi:hypothetical protein [Geobacillus kaustophilus]|nr:hypothetical protein [Geobacillus kaustophilus]